MLEYEVTLQDIENGHPSEETSCAIAQALRRENPGFGVSVESANEIWIGNTRYEAREFEKVNRFIEDFDECKDVKPFMLWLDKWVDDGTDDE